VAIGSERRRRDEEQALRANEFLMRVVNESGNPAHNPSNRYLAA
jgi:hypothetical protein